MESETRRLHPLSWLFITAKSLKSLILPAIFVIFASRSNPWARYELLGFIFLIPTVIAALIRQKIFSYRFDEDQLVVRQGLFTKKERHIPYERIHNIARVQNPFHRLLGVAAARVETAGGGEPEAVMHVLPLEAIEELRQRTLGPVLGRSTAAVAASPSEAKEDDELILHLPAGEIAKLGLISRRGFLLLAGAAGLLSQTNWWEFTRWEKDWERWPGSLQDVLPLGFIELLKSAPLLAQLVFGAGLLLLFLALMLAASVVWHLIKYHGFTLRRDRGDLRRDYGLLTRVSSMIPVRRIQLVSATSSILHRLFRRTSIEIETAGSSESGSDLDKQLAQSGVSISLQYLAPIIAVEQAPRLLREVFPGIDLEAVDWQFLPPRARRRLMKRAILWTALFTVILLGILRIAGGPGAALNAFWLPAILLPLAWMRATGWLRYSAWGMTDEAVFFRSGWLDRGFSLVPLNKIQTVSLEASPFDRRRHMARLAVDTAGAGTFGHRIRIPYLDRDVADALFQRLYGEAAATEFDWYQPMGSR